MPDPLNDRNSFADSIFRKENLLFIVLAAFFVCNALIAEFIGVKIFSLEETLGMDALNLSLFGQERLSFNLTAGVLLWPVVFLLTDIVNDYYGVRGVRFLSYLASALISYAFFMFYFGMELPPASFWLERELETGITVNMQHSFNAIFGQGLWIIVGSLVAFLIGQLLDAYIFRGIKRLTGDRRIWLRATASTLVSQLIDSFVVLFIAFYLGAGWDLSLVLAIGVVNYIYKFVVAIGLIPALYGIHWLIERYLGKGKAEEMRLRALVKRS
ncbi:MAG TPA: VUT family protein [Bacteroidetes bacterium]|nr:VUT family protein [Bacteroidota bacterium]